VALRFVDAVQAAHERISDFPSIGARRYADLPFLEEVRMWAVPDFEKYLIFYLERDNYVDIVRVLHGSRDIPAILMDILNP
jgi:toxin ParE1/3/4